MKKYLTPSIEINKFDVEDIITASGAGVTNVGELSQPSQDLYNAATTTTGGIAAETTPNSGAFSIVEYEW